MSAISTLCMRWLSFSWVSLIQETKTRYSLSYRASFFAILRFATFVNAIYKFSSNCKDILDRDYFELLKFASKNAKTLRHSKKQLVLFLFANLLNQASSKDNQHTLSVFDLLDFIIDFNEYVIEKNRLLREKLTLTNLSKKIDVKWVKLNID